MRQKTAHYCKSSGISSWDIPHGNILKFRTANRESNINLRFVVSLTRGPGHSSSVLNNND
jgi:hypothetical protein